MPPTPYPMIDLQVNGYAGVDFNSDALEGGAMRAACERLERDGVRGVLATVITDAPDRMAAKIAKIVALREQDAVIRRVVRGLHVEGPFLNAAEGYIGAHPAQHARPADGDVMRRLLEAGGGCVRLVTLAPECDTGLAVTRLLARQGVRVAAGHSDASLDQLQASLDAGLTMYTHLGNGCPMRMHRHDNIIQRVLHLADRLTISFIADGAHVPWPALGNYLRLVPEDRVVIVSDTIAAAGLGPGRYTLGGREVMVGQDGVPRSPDGSHFVGSGCPLPKMAENLRLHLNIPDARLEQWLATTPEKLLGRDL